MTTPVHLAVNFGIYLALAQVPSIETNYTDLALILGANLIDLDHLLVRPIYVPMRNSFKTHLLHKPWKCVLVVCACLMLFRPLMFLGIGVATHYLLDFIDNKRRGI